MAKDKSKKKEGKHLPPIRIGDRYVCPHCGAALPTKQDCPACRLEIDWTKI